MDAQITEENQNINVINNKIKRQSNFELLRIISMLLIIASHWGWLYLSIDIYSLSHSRVVFYSLFRSCGQVGVVLFVLISGYFMCTKKFNIMGLIKLFMQIILLNLFGLLIDFIFSKTIDGYTFALHKSNILNFLLPFQGGYWFVFVYSLMYLLSPLLNILISKLNEKQFIFILLILIFFCSIYHSFFGDQYLAMTFILLYMLASFIRLYPHYFKIKKLPLFFIILCLGLIYAKATMLEINPSMQESNNILLICMCIAIFLWFSQLKLGSNKLINTISSTTFGVYILHTFPFFGIRLWTDVLKQHILIKSDIYYIHAIASVLVVFIVCSVIDLIRKLIFEKPMEKFIYKFFNNQINHINKIFDKPNIVPVINKQANYKFLLFLLQILITYIIAIIGLNKIYQFSILLSYTIFLIMNICIISTISLIKLLRNIKINKTKK